MAGQDLFSSSKGGGRGGGQDLFASHPSKKKKVVHHGFWSHVADPFVNTGHAIAGIPVGLYHTGGAVVHDVARGLSPSHPWLREVAHGHNPLPHTYKDVVVPLGQSYKHKYYDPFAQRGLGGFGLFATRAFAEDPLGTALDAVTIATLGVGGAVRIGALTPAERSIILHGPAVEGLDHVPATITKGLAGRTELSARTRLAADRLLKEHIAAHRPILGEQARYGRAVMMREARDLAMQTVKVLPYLKARAKLSRPEEVAFDVMHDFPHPAGLEMAKEAWRNEEWAKHTLKQLDSPKVKKAFEQGLDNPDMAAAWEEAKKLGEASGELADLHPFTQLQRRYLQLLIQKGAHMENDPFRYMTPEGGWSDAAIGKSAHTVSRSEPSGKVIAYDPETNTVSMRFGGSNKLTKEKALEHHQTRIQGGEVPPPKKYEYDVHDIPLSSLRDPEKFNLYPPHGPADLPLAPEPVVSPEAVAPATPAAPVLPPAVQGLPIELPGGVSLAEKISGLEHGLAGIKERLGIIEKLKQMGAHDDEYLGLVSTAARDIKWAKFPNKAAAVEDFWRRAHDIATNKIDKLRAQMEAQAAERAATHYVEVRLPRKFYFDHVSRDLPAGEIIKETKSHVYVRLTEADHAELLSDAEHYADPVTAAQMGDPGLTSSARATAKALRQRSPKKMAEAAPPPPSAAAAAAEADRGLESFNRGEYHPPEAAAPAAAPAEHFDRPGFIEEQRQADIQKMIDGIKQELDAANRPEPLYRHHTSQVKEVNPSPHAGGGSGPTTKKVVRQTKGTLSKLGRVIYGEDTLAPQFMLVVRRHLAELRHVQLLKAGIPVDVGTSLADLERATGQRWRYIRQTPGDRPTYLEMTDQEYAKALEAHDAYVKSERMPNDIGEELTTTDERDAFETPETDTAPGGMRVVIPESMVKQVAGEFQRATNIGAKMFRGATGGWRTLVLNLRLGWLVNNMIGNTGLYFLQNTGPGAFRELIGRHPDSLRAEHVARGLPEQISAGFSATNRPTGRLGKAMEEKAVLRQIKRLPEHLRNADIRYEQRLRIATINRALNANPEIRNLSRTIDRQTTDIREVKVSKLRDDPVLADQVAGEAYRTLGNFNNMTYAEKNIIRAIVPFYAWYRAITKIALTLPLDNPLRTLLLNEVGKEGFKKQAQFGSPPILGAIPLPGGYVLKTAGLNPLNTVPQALGATQTLARAYLGAIPKLGVKSPSARELAFAAGILNPLITAPVTGGFTHASTYLPQTRLLFPPTSKTYADSGRGFGHMSPREAYLAELLGYAGVPIRRPLPPKKKKVASKDWFAG